ncbi:MAG TPA: histone deacetylase [Bryobacteraceae bacterium]|nr:histone deacetylase [Bryobacteraceae bacterium]
MLPLVYHDGYDLHIGQHVFPTRKYRLIKERLGWPVVAPAPAADADILRVHTRAWTEGMRDGTLSPLEIQRLEIPWSPETAQAFWLAAGGTIRATELAMEHGGAYNIGGGFHHAFAGHGEGFCAIHDVAVAIRKFGRRALVVDVDVHHGNGTAAIFHGEESVYTLSIHQLRNYPAIKPPSDCDLHLDDGVGDEEYLRTLGPAVVRAFDEHKPEILFYVAGADPYEDDQLGGLRLTIDGLRRRDELVLGEAAKRKIPFVVTLAGGYAYDVEDTVTIHANTAIAGAAALGLK